jgi:hypothetical protein
MTSHISRATRSIFNKIAFGIAVITLAGCTHQETAEPTVMGPLTQVYEASFEEVWRSLQKTLAYYPIQLNNADTGIIETDVIRPDKMWRPAQKSKPFSPGLRYVIKAAAIKGVKGQDKEAIRLSIEKIVTIERDFFAGTERQPSDGLEEESIFYRVQREITLERSLKAAYDQGKL